MMFIDVSVLCTVRAHMLTYRYEMHTVFAMLTVYSWISLIGKVLIFPTYSWIYFRISGDAHSVGGDAPVDDEVHFVNFKMICRLSLSEMLIGVGCACVRS